MTLLTFRRIALAHDLLPADVVPPPAPEWTAAPKEAREPASPRHAPDLVVDQKA